MLKVTMALAATLALFWATQGQAWPPQPPPTHQVRWVGELRKVKRDGDLKGYADLNKIGKLPHVYAVGPIEGLRGEVTLWDGKPFVVAIQDGKVAVRSKLPPRACFLVYAQVKKWKKVGISEPIDTVDDLETLLTKKARQLGLSVKQPLVFLIRGKAQWVKYHIINKTDNKPHDHEQHEKAKVKLVLRDQPVKLLGFYSDRHMGVFTCEGNFHLHVITEDGKQSGHVNALKLAKGSQLYLPIGR